MRLDKEDLLLYGVTDRTWVGEKSLIEQIEESLEGGVTCIQIREKELNDSEFKKEAMEIKELVDKYKVPLIINDSVQIAIEIGATGVHIGQQDMDIEDARALIGSGMVLGVSTSTVEEAIEAEKKGADYLGVGAVFTTSTKNNASSVSKQLLKQICDAVSIPVVAIGGITESNMHVLEGSGIVGVAIVSAIYGQKNIEVAVKRLKDKAYRVIK